MFVYYLNIIKLVIYFKRFFLNFMKIGVIIYISKILFPNAFSLSLIKHFKLILLSLVKLLLLSSKKVSITNFSFSLFGIFRLLGVNKSLKQFKKVERIYE